MVVLGREWMPLGGYFVLSASLTSINATVRRCVSGVMDFIKCLMVQLLKILRVFINSHLLLLEK